MYLCKEVVNMKKTIEIINELAIERPIFHSEADFQFALAWMIKNRYADLDIRLEKPINNNDLQCTEAQNFFQRRNRYIDIVLTYKNGKTVPIELKYKTKKLEYISDNGEYFNLKSHLANDHARYDFVKDICRIENYLIMNSNSDYGYAIMLTNDLLLEQRKKKPSNDASFEIYNGRILEQELKWSDNTSEGTKKTREASIKLKGKYKLKWFNYPNNSPKLQDEFRVLIVKINKKEFV